MSYVRMSLIANVLCLRCSQLNEFRFFVQLENLTYQRYGGTVVVRPWLRKPWLQYLHVCAVKLVNTSSREVVKLVDSTVLVFSTTFYNEHHTLGSSCIHSRALLTVEPELLVASASPAESEDDAPAEAPASSPAASVFFSIDIIIVH